MALFLRRLIRSALVVMALGVSVPAMASYVNTNGVNCRTKPEANAQVVQRLTEGLSVSISEAGGGWSRLVKPSCWIRSEFLASDYVAQTFSSPAKAGRAARSQSRRMTVRQGGSKYAFHFAAPKASKSRRKSARVSKRRSGASGAYSGGGSCPCSGGSVCIGPRGGRFCITSGGNKRYGV